MPQVWAQSVFSGRKHPLGCQAGALVLALAQCVGFGPAIAAEPAMTRVRAREVALHFALSGAGGDTVVDLWYTRDRGKTWLPYELGDQRTSPLRFIAPAEGLYGFVITAREPGRVFTRDDILSRLRGREADLYTRAVDILVSRLRRKLEPLVVIKTLRHAGYAFALGRTP